MKSTFLFKTTNYTKTKVLWEIILLLLVALVCECSAVFKGSSRNPRAKNRHNENHFLDEADQTWDERPMGLIDWEDEVMSTNEYGVSEFFMRKRTKRSPLDDEIDDIEDSDEDSDEDDEAESEKSTTPATTIKPANSVTKILPVNIETETSGKKLDQNGNVSDTDTLANHMPINNRPQNASNSQVSTTHKVVPANGTGRALPPRPQFHPGKPPAGGNHPNMKPPPRGGFQLMPGKLPPHLLNYLPKSKPPPKKGELYLPEDYNNLVIPKLNLGRLIGINSYSAVPVLVFLNIRSVRDIDESMETLTLDLDLVIEWVDGFLFDPISAITTRQADIILNPIFLKKIWRPDIYIDEIVRVKRTSLMSKPLKLKFNPATGFISYTTRLTVQLSCDMIYFYYPADTHRCEFTFRSYSYFSKDMELSWLGAGVYLQDPYDANFDLQVESIDHIKLPQTFRRLTNDTFDGLKFTLLARRKMSFHMVQTYLPSIFFIVITWLCFLVPARMVEARIGISMTTLLTLTSMFASVRESTPIVSYVKAIDIWMVFCIFFVFLTLLEFATLIWLRSRREDAEEKKLDRQREAQALQGNQKRKDLEMSHPHRLSSVSSESVQLRKYEKFAEFTEKFAFFIFSIVFLIFNVIYWSWLLVASNYFDWSVNATLNADLD